MADRRGSNAKSDSHDPFEESLEELNRIADDLVDGLSLEGDASEAGLAAGQETSPLSEAERGPGTSTVEELTRQIDHPDAEGDTNNGPSGDEVADLFAHVDSLLASQDEAEAVEEPESDTTEAPPHDTEPHQADVRRAEDVGEDTIELDAEDVEAAEEFVDELQAKAPDFETPADANIDRPPVAEVLEDDRHSREAFADENVPEEAAVELAEEPVGEFADEPIVEFAEEPVGEFADEPIVEFAEEPVGEFAEEPVGEFANEPVVEFAEEPVGEFADEPVGELEEEPVAELAEEPVATEFDNETDAGAVPWPPEGPDQATEAAEMTEAELAHANSVAAAAEPVFETSVPRPSRAPWVVAAVFATAVLGVAAWWLLFQRPTPPTQNPTSTSSVAAQRGAATRPVRTAPVLPDASDVGPAIQGPAMDPTWGSAPTSATVPSGSEDVEDAGTTLAPASVAPLEIPSPERPPSSVAERSTSADPVPTRVETSSPPTSTARSIPQQPPNRRTAEQVQRSFGRLATQAAGTSTGNSTGASIADPSEDSSSDLTGGFTGDSESETPVRESAVLPDTSTTRSDDDAPAAAPRTRAPDRNRPTTESSSVGLAGSTGPDTVETPAITIPAAPKIEPYRHPEVLERVEPAYPPRALKRGEGGTIVLKVLVDEQGSVARVVVEQGLDGSELEAAAIGAVLRWRYRPASENGHEIRGWTTETFVFDPAE